MGSLLVNQYYSWAVTGKPMTEVLKSSNAKAVQREWGNWWWSRRTRTAKEVKHYWYSKRSDSARYIPCSHIPFYYLIHTPEYLCIKQHIVEGKAKHSKHSNLEQLLSNKITLVNHPMQELPTTRGKGIQIHSFYQLVLISPAHLSHLVNFFDKCAIIQVIPLQRTGIGNPPILFTPAWVTETHLDAKDGHTKHICCPSCTLLAQQNHVIMQLPLDFFLGVHRCGFFLVEGADLEYKADLVILLLILVIACHNEIRIAFRVLFRDILSCKEWLIEG